MKTDLSSFNNHWYHPGSPVKRGLWFMVNAFVFKTSLFPFYSLKTWLLKLFGAKVGKGVLIKPCVNIKFPWKLRIGDHVWIGEQVWIDNLAEVTIGDNVCLSQGAYLLTGNHNYKKSCFDLMIGMINIEEGVWIGAKSIVCPGVTCFSHSVLTAGSVATKDLSAYSINVGNPSIRMKDRIIGV